MVVNPDISQISNTRPLLIFVFYKGVKTSVFAKFFNGVVMALISNISENPCLENYASETIITVITLRVTFTNGPILARPLRDDSFYGQLSRHCRRLVSPLQIP